MTAPNIPVVKRIYISRGDEYGKFMGFSIGKSLYWYCHSFQCPTELNRHLEKLNIHINKAGEWGFIENGKVVFDKKATKIGMSHDKMFSEDSSYGKRAKDSPHGDMFWSMSQLLESFIVLKHYTGAEIINIIKEKGIESIVYGFNFCCKGNEDTGSISFPIKINDTDTIHFHINSQQQYEGDYESEFGHYQYYITRYRTLNHLIIKQESHHRTLTVNEIDGYAEINQYLDSAFDGMRVYHNYDENRNFEGESYELKDRANT